MESKKKTSVAVDVEKNAPLKTKEYEKELRRLHVELVKLQQWVVAKGLKVCIVFEGRDGATALPGEIHQAKHVPVAEGTYPGFEFREFAARIRGADKRSYGTSRNDIDVNAHLV